MRNRGFTILDVSGERGSYRLQGFTKRWELGNLGGVAI
jgi:hypothetical protein